ncbi:MAG TPA: hypothetical protein VG965_04350 [Patescibacteria group bacterium]|nr:hypothetical protein [Patescibacteria group bacterium]
MTAERPLQGEEFRRNVASDPFLGLSGNPEQLEIDRAYFHQEMSHIENKILEYDSFTPHQATLFGMQLLEGVIIQSAIHGRYLASAGDPMGALLAGDAVLLMREEFYQASQGNNFGLKNFIETYTNNLQLPSDLDPSSINPDAITRIKGLGNKYMLIHDAIPDTGAADDLPQELAFFNGGVIRPFGYDYPREFFSKPSESLAELRVKQANILVKDNLLDDKVANLGEVSEEEAISIALEALVIEQIGNEIIARMKYWEGDVASIDSAMTDIVRTDTFLQLANEGQYIGLRLNLEQRARSLRELADATSDRPTERRKYLKAMFKINEIGNIVPETGTPIDLDRIKQVTEGLLS